MLQRCNRRNRCIRDQKVLRPATTTGGVKTRLCLDFLFLLLCAIGKTSGETDEKLLRSLEFCYVAVLLNGICLPDYGDTDLCL